MNIPDSGVWVLSVLQLGTLTFKFLPTSRAKGRIFVSMTFDPWTDVFIVESIKVRLRAISPPIVKICFL